jgi:hypothetical protein
MIIPGILDCLKKRQTTNTTSRPDEKDLDNFKNIILYKSGKNAKNLNILRLRDEMCSSREQLAGNNAALV